MIANANRGKDDPVKYPWELDPWEIADREAAEADVDNMDRLARDFCDGEEVGDG